jgi:ribonuclease HIII
MADWLSKEIQTLIQDNFTFFEVRTPDERETEFGYPIIGTDESGKGDYFGPFLTAAV